MRMQVPLLLIVYLEGITIFDSQASHYTNSSQYSCL